MTYQYQLPDLTYPNSTVQNNEHKLFYLQAYKKNYTLNHLCKKLHETDNGLETFCQEVEQLSYSQKPDYKKLRAILRGLI